MLTSRHYAHRRCYEGDNGVDSMNADATATIIEVSPWALTRPRLRVSHRGIDYFTGRLMKAGLDHFCVAIREHTDRPARHSESSRDGAAAAEPGTGTVHWIEEAASVWRPDGTRNDEQTSVTLGVSPTDGYARAVYGEAANSHRIRRLDQISRAASVGLKVRARIEVAYGCPYQGEVAEAEIADLATDLYDHGCSEIVLGDLLGVATPNHAASLVETVLRKVPAASLGVRFHDTYGLGLANVFACLRSGVSRFECSLGGVCVPARGNYPLTPVATEDVVNLLHRSGVTTGLDLAALVAASQFIAAELGQVSVSKTAAAFRAAGCRV